MSVILPDNRVGGWGNALKQYSNEYGLKEVFLADLGGAHYLPLLPFATTYSPLHMMA